MTRHSAFIGLANERNAPIIGMREITLVTMLCLLLCGCDIPNTTPIPDGTVIFKDGTRKENVTVAEFMKMSGA